MAKDLVAVDGAGPPLAEVRPAIEDPGRVVAHRGASRAAPENTLAAFRLAAEQGARWIEFDVSLLGDGTPVVFHDATLDRCTDATGSLSAIGRADLGRIHAGARRGGRFADEPIPTLEAVLDLVEELGLHANLEMKAHATPRGATTAAVVAALNVRAWARERIVVSSFDLEELGAFRAALPDAAVAVLYRRPPRDWQHRVTALRAEAVHLRIDGIRQDLLLEASAAGLRVRVYTVNRPEVVIPYRELGLTGVITDDPSLFLRDPDWAAWAAR